MQADISCWFLGQVTLKSRPAWLAEWFGLLVRTTVSIPATCEVCLHLVCHKAAP